MAFIRSARNGLVIGITSDAVGVMPRFNIGESNKAVIRPVQEREFAKARNEYKAVTSTMADHTESAAPQQHADGDTITAVALENKEFGSQKTREAKRARKLGVAKDESQDVEDVI